VTGKVLPVARSGVDRTSDAAARRGVISATTAPSSRATWIAVPAGTAESNTMSAAFCVEEASGAWAMPALPAAMSVPPMTW